MFLGLTGSTLLRAVSGVDGIPGPEGLSMSSFPSAPDRGVACCCGGFIKYIHIISIIMNFHVNNDT